ncbi:atherin-like isoform X2 [Panicum virgatum]|nr:atherin-like isoform X2 [Panicum virgatum]
MHKYPFGLSGNRRSGPNAVEHLTFSLNCVKKMALVLFKRLSHGGVLRTFKMTLVNTYPTSPTVLLTTCASDPPAVTTAKPPAASAKGDCSHAPKAPGCDPPAAPAKKPDGCDPDEAAPAVEPPAYPPSGDCPCDPQQAQPVGPGAGTRHDPKAPTPDP